MHSTRNIIRNVGESNIYFLREREDFNTVQDLLNNIGLIETNCPNLYQLLRKYGYNRSLIGKYVNFDDLQINIPVVSAIIERVGIKEMEILMQIRYKPNIDPKNTGKLEIPGGIINKREKAYEAVIREVKEEVGINVKIKDKFEVTTHSDEEETSKSVSYQPFSCSQQLEGDRAYIIMNFICEVIGGELMENRFETREPRWVSLSELEYMVYNEPERVFSLNIPTLKHYLSERRNNKP